jgi:hypothetical protein
MMQGRFRGGEIDDHFASIKKPREIVGNQDAHTASTSRLSGIVTHSEMAFPFDRTGQRQSGRLFDKSDQPTPHATGCPSDNNIDHPKPYPLHLTLNEACVL